MAGRPYWSGQFKVSLVSFGIQLFPATSSESGVTFHQIDRTSGERIRHLNVIDGDQPVENSEIVKGYEYSKGKYLIVEPDEIANLRIATRNVIDVQQFVALDELPPALFEKPYFVVPEPKESPEAFGVFRDAMKKTGKAAIGKIAFSGREHIIAIKPADGGRGMMGYTLRYQDELRNQADYFRDIKPAEINEDSLQLAESLIAKRSAKFDLGKFEDGYEVAVKELVEAKVNNLPVPKDETPDTRRNNVVNLMDALRKSLDSDSAAQRPPKKPVKSEKEPARRSIGLVKPTAKTAARRRSA